MKFVDEFLYFSVGFAAQTGEKLTKLMQNLIEQDKISEKEAKIFLDEYAEKVEEMTKKFDEKLEDFVKEKLEDMTFVTGEEIKKVEDRISKLEKLIDEKLASKESKAQEKESR